MKDAYTLRDEIMSLSDAERHNLLALVESQEAARPFRATREDLALWDALLHLSPASHRSLDGFLRDRQGGVSRNAWAAAVDALADFTAQVKTVRSAEEDHGALVTLALRCLVSDLRQRRVEVTVKKIIENLPRLRMAVDAAFPGYIEAGLLHMLIRLSPVAAAAE